MNPEVSVNASATLQRCVVTQGVVRDCSEGFRRDYRKMKFVHRVTTSLPQALAIIWTIGAPYSVLAQPSTYPLHPGDRWEYWTQGADATYDFRISAVYDTLLPNGIQYTYVVGDPYFPKPFQRQSQDSVFQFNLVLGMETLLYNFSAAPGTPITRYQIDGDTIQITLLREQIVTIFDRNLRQWEFLIDHNTHAIDDEEYVYITDSLGVTSTICFCDPGASRLHGAYIAGVQYGEITGVSESGITLPRSLALQQNYPNPFNPRTTITFSIRHFGAARLVVINSLGEVVTTLVSGELLPSTYVIPWDASGLPSGLYFYQLQVGSDHLTKSSILLK